MKEKKDYRLARTFINNTLNALTQYEENLGREEQSYSHTLFINACVGLLIVPEESVLEELPNVEINKKEWGISSDDIRIVKDGKSVQNIAKQMRHSIAHFNFTFEYSEYLSVPIRYVQFKNWKDNFETEEISFEAFKTFVLKIAKETLNIINIREK